MSRRAIPRNIRAVVVTTDGKQYLTPWRATMRGALSAAKRFAERNSLQVKRIDGY
jgi:hypothetical protein